MYAYIVNDKIQEIIPDIDPTFPDVPIEDRYESEFLSHCEHFEDNADIQVGMERQEDGSWAFPPAPEPTPTPDDGGGDDITIDDLALAVAELAEQEEADKIETEMAIAELAEVILNG